ncbi:hypothetical protein AZE42_05652 [Rhizopogon vesiculosus]|uniref:Uncharacterized protein n=1 Tax=Rhizopogon vesiculosus TaxID=180088 RepID=A0A1J8RCV0_9AGAM|nr:hypothetical protein AZE42_05652 [Rhizopogon vesiculosus]
MDVPGYSHKKEMIYGGENASSVGRRGLDAKSRGLEADTDAGKSNLAAVDPS